jgi:Carboxypeptidase regulatory-like domain
MNLPSAPSSWRGLQLFLGAQASLPACFGQLFLGAQASLPACFGQLVFWLIVTGFLLITSPSLLAQTNDKTATVGGRIAGQARTPALPDNAGAVQGRVTDASGAVLAGASVTPGNSATGPDRVVTTDANRNFAFAASNGAGHRLIVSAVEFAPISRELESALRDGHQLKGGVEDILPYTSSARRNEACEINPASAPPIN